MAKLRTRRRIAAIENHVRETMAAEGQTRRGFGYAVLVRIHLQALHDHGRVSVPRVASLWIIGCPPSQILQVRKLGGDEDWGGPPV